MNLMPAKIGAEPKKVAVVLVLLAVAAYFYISNRNSGESDAPSRSIAPTAVSTAPAAGAGQRAGTRPVSRSAGRGSGSNNPREFRPSMKPPKGVDPSATDPTLHLNALAKLQDVKLEATTRSLFEISATPSVEAKLMTEPAKIKPAFVPYGPKAPPPPPPPPPTPRAPAIPLKFYGFVNPTRPDVKHAFFLDNDEIIVAGEGDLIKKRYKILRIGVNSAEVEDTQFKGDNTKQTLPLETEWQG
jgi:hypothetical protein